MVQPKTQATQPNRGASPGGSSQPQPLNSFASFRYTGPMSVTVTGAISGRQYKFGQTGAVVQIDARDKAVLAKVPHLRQI